MSYCFRGYSKLNGMSTVESLFEDNIIDTVYVRYHDTEVDKMFDCHQPYNMIQLEKIMRERSPRVMGWRFQHHRRALDQEETHTRESEYDMYGGPDWRRDGLPLFYYEMIRETSGGDSFLTTKCSFFHTSINLLFLQNVICFSTKKNFASIHYNCKYLF